MFQKHIPSVFENVVANVRYRGAEFRLHLYDTAGKVWNLLCTILQVRSGTYSVHMLL